MTERLTDRQIAREAGLSVSTLKRWHCWLCEANMLCVRRGWCWGVMGGQRCDPEEMRKNFSRWAEERRAAKLKRSREEG